MYTATAWQNATSNSKPENHTECRPVRAPAAGRQREEQEDPPPKKKQQGWEGAQERPKATTRSPTPQEAAKPPTQTAPKTVPPKGAPGDHPAETGNTKPRAAAQREKGHPKHADTHHAKKTQKNQTTRPGREGMGGQRPRDPRPGQPATDITKQKKKTKGEGGGALALAPGTAPLGAVGDPTTQHRALRGVLQPGDKLPARALAQITSEKAGYDLGLAMLCRTHWIQRRWPPKGTVPWIWAIPSAHTQIEAGPDTRPNPPPERSNPSAAGTTPFRGSSAAWVLAQS